VTPKEIRRYREISRENERSIIKKAVSANCGESFSLP
jgi:hypothetical protein